MDHGEPALLELNREASIITGVKECSGSPGVHDVLRGLDEEDLKKIKGAIMGDVELEEMISYPHQGRTKLFRLKIVRPSPEIASVFLIDVTSER